MNFTFIFEYLLSDCLIFFAMVNVCEHSVFNETFVVKLENN